MVARLSIHHGGKNRQSFSSGCRDIKISGWVYKLIFFVPFPPIGARSTRFDVAALTQIFATFDLTRKASGRYRNSGSAKGCQFADSCAYKHDDPLSVAPCKNFSQAEGDKTIYAIVCDLLGYFDGNYV